MVNHIIKNMQPAPTATNAATTPSISATVRHGDRTPKAAREMLILETLEASSSERRVSSNPWMAKPCVMMSEFSLSRVL